MSKISEHGATPELIKYAKLLGYDVEIIENRPPIFNLPNLRISYGLRNFYDDSTWGWKCADVVDDCIVNEREYFWDLKYALEREIGKEKKIEFILTQKRLQAFCRRLKIVCNFDGTFDSEKYRGFKTINERKRDGFLFDTWITFHFFKKVK